MEYQKMKKTELTKSPLPAKKGSLPLYATAMALFALLFATASATAKVPFESLDSSDAHYKVENGVATIYGTADDTIQKKLIERIVLGFSNVEEVRNELVLVDSQPEIDNNIGATVNN